MNRGGFRGFLAACALALPSGIAMPGASWGDAREAEIRDTMRGIFQSIRVLLPLAASWERFQSPANQPAIHAALRALAESTSQVEAHAARSDAGFGFLGRSLGRDSRDALAAFERGHFTHAEFLVRQVTEHCIACHSRLPSPGDSPLAEDFIDGTALSKLPLVERAELEIATRRFDAALASFEKLFASRVVHPAQMLGPLTDYLTIAIRVKEDLARPVPVLEKFAARRDVRRYIRFDVERWIAALLEFQARPAPPPTLEAARAVIREARSLISFPADRQALVHYVVASKALYGFIESDEHSDEQLAEAYYLLGLMESRIGREYGASQTGFYLETAIRRAPHAPFAEVAYAILEEETLLDFGALRGEELPEDVARRLSELQSLIEEAASERPQEPPREASRLHTPEPLAAISRNTQQ